MNAIRLAKILSSLVLVPAAAALLTAVIYADSPGRFSTWCAAHWWQMFLACAALHYALGFFAFWLGRRASRS